MRTITNSQDGTCGAPGAVRAARRVREEARRNGSIERRDRASGLLHHRLFSQITMNWRGRPLETHEVVVETIAATTTTTGLTIQAALDTNTYQRGIKITDKEMKAFEATHLQRHAFHGDWNYTVCAAPDTDTTHPNQRE